MMHLEVKHSNVDRFNVTQFDTVNNPKDITGTKIKITTEASTGKITSASVINGGSGHKKNDKLYIDAGDIGFNDGSTTTTGRISQPKSNKLKLLLN